MRIFAWVRALIGFIWSLSLLTTIAHATGGSEEHFMHHADHIEKIVFAGGCFWCVQKDFDHLSGVVKTEVGYAGGTTPDPNYQTVSAGHTDHAEVVEVSFDPKQVDLDTVFSFFWHNIDPTVANQQFCDQGKQYRTAIYAYTDAQVAAAQASKQALEQQQRFPKVFSEIKKIDKFYPGEDYHQKYYVKNPVRYRFYRYSCGRDQRLKKIWGEQAGKP